MSFLLRRARFHCWLTTSSPTNLGVHASLRFFSNGGGSDQDTSFTVSYLQNFIGLSPEAALSASKQVSFTTCEKPDLVVKLLQGYGFTGTDITALVRSHPRILTSNFEKTISPKLEFLKSKAFSWPQMAHNVSVFPTILRKSLDNQIVPAFEFFKSMIPSEKKLISAISRCPDLLAQNVSTYIVPKIAILRENGVSDSNIAAFVLANTRAVMVSSDKFRTTLERVFQLGFDSSSYNFILAVSVLGSMRKSTWESKIESLKKRGWSEEEILTAFKKHPLFMKTSVDKIEATADFFFREMGLSHLHIASYPRVVNYSLERRMIPRLRVIRTLLSKGLIKKEYSIALVYGLSEENFLKRFVSFFQADAPELMKLYEDSKLGLSSGSDIH